MLPNFFVVGAQKAGTTSLYNYLKTHPDIYLPAQKESKFFADNNRYMKGMDYYKTEFFSAGNEEKAIGEVDPDYMYFRHSITRIAKDLDLTKIKFIFILRNPADRAFSHYLMTYRRGLETFSFEEAVMIESERIKTDYHSNLHYSYTSRGFYFNQINRFLEYVDNSQLLFLFSEDLLKYPAKCLMACFDFLGVSADFIPDNIEQKYHKGTVPRSLFFLYQINKESIGKKIFRRILINAGLRKKLRRKLLEFNQTSDHGMSLSAETRRKLSTVYEADIQRLADLTGCNLDHWTHDFVNSGKNCGD